MATTKSVNLANAASFIDSDGTIQNIAAGSGPITVSKNPVTGTITVSTTAQTSAQVTGKSIAMSIVFGG